MRARFSTLPAVVLFTGLAAVFALRADAHDLLLESTHDHLDARVEVSLRLFMGVGTAPTTMKPTARRTATYVCITPDGRRHIPGAKDAGLGLFDAETPGLYVFAFGTRANLVSASVADMRLVLEAAGAFKQYGARLKQPRARPWRVEEFHNAKSFVVVGSGNAGRLQATTGLAVEFFLDQRPDALKPGSMVGLRLMSDGKPIPGARLVAYPRVAPTREIEMVTTADGRARFKLPAAGAWVLRAVRVVPAARRKAAEWVVRRATLTFDVPTPAPLKVDAKAKAKPTPKDGG